MNLNQTQISSGGRMSAGLFSGLCLLAIAVLPAGKPLSASSIKVCAVKARILKVYPVKTTADANAPERKGNRRIRIQVEKAVFEVGHSMGRDCTMRGMKLDIDLRIKPEQFSVLKKGTLLNLHYRTVINQRRMDGRYRFVRFTSWKLVPARTDNNRPTPPRPR